MKRFTVVLIAIFFTASIEAQTTWEHRSTEDAVWTEAAEDTATVYLVHGASDFTPDYGNTLCNHIARGLNDETWINSAAEDPSPDNWPDWIMRGDGLQYISGDLPGVRMNGCWSNEWIFVAETHSEVGSSGVLRFENGNTAVIVFAHVVGSRDGLPDPAPVVIDTDGRWISHRICSQDEFFGLDACDEYRRVLLGDLERLCRLDEYEGTQTCLCHLNGQECSGVSGETITLGEQDGTSELEVEVKGETVSAEAETPTTFALEQNYPNPFNPSTTIEFALDKAGHVTLSVYDLLGQRVRVLMDGVQPAARYAVPFDATNLASGTYLYILQTEEQVAVKTMALLK